MCTLWLNILSLEMIQELSSSLFCLVPLSLNFLLFYKFKRFLYNVSFIAVKHMVAIVEDIGMMAHIQESDGLP